MYKTCRCTTFTINGSQIPNDQNWDSYLEQLAPVTYWKRLKITKAMNKAEMLLLNNEALANELQKLINK